MAPLSVEYKMLTLEQKSKDNILRKPCHYSKRHMIFLKNLSTASLGQLAAKKDTFAVALDTEISKAIVASPVKPIGNIEKRQKPVLKRMQWLGEFTISPLPKI